MADKHAKLIIDALRRAATERGGLPLIASRQSPGLFPATSIGKAAAEKACAAAWLRPVGDDCWTVSETGFKRLLEDESPKQVLEDCVRAIEARQDQLEQLRAKVSRIHASLDGLRATVEAVLPTINSNSALDTPTCCGLVDEVLSRWESEASEDCPLPELFRQLQDGGQVTTLGAFHDVLRRMHAEGRLYLHPWTGPLYAIPEPSYALLVGHEVAYYASSRAAEVAPGDEWVRSEAG